MPPRRLARLPLPGRYSRRLAAGVGALDREAAADPRVSHPTATRGAAVLIISALAAIAGGSVGLVQAAVTLATAWHIPASIVGTLVLAGLTSLPNAYAAARLALHGRDAALVSETFNSNTINLAAGVGLPVLVLGVADAPDNAARDLLWLVGLTIAVLGLLARPGGLSRRGGLLIIALYALFVLSHLG